MKILIIGGVAGGASAAARLRRLNESAEIVIFERGQYISYANCGLPYYIGGEITDKSALTLQTPASFKSRFNVDVRVNSEVTSIDPAKKQVEVYSWDSFESYTETYDKLILSPGAEPLVPPLEGVEAERIFTVRNIPDTYKIREYIDLASPKTAVVVGGGYIGVEMAENLVAAGLSVSLIELSDHLIAPLDYDSACDLHHYARAKGIDLQLNTKVQGFEDSGDGILVITDHGGVACDMVIMAVGVRPDSSLAKECGLAINPKGAIIVNQNMLTSDPDIYAVGDAVEVTNFVSGQQGYIPLAGPANKQGRIAADNICGIASQYNGTQGSAVLKFFDMTVGTTGLNETAIKALGIPYDKVFLFSASHATYYPGATQMAVKVLFETPSGRILGGQIVGYDGVDKRCDVLATAIRGNMTVFDLTELELCYAPPFSSAKDPVNMAGFAAQNILDGRIKQYHWNEIDSLPTDGSIVMLDTRTAAEFARGAIPGTINVPLDELRENLDKIPSGKPLYVNCQSGLRSYVACCILSQNGFDCHNLGGGYRLYNQIMTDKSMA